MRRVTLLAIMVCLLALAPGHSAAAAPPTGGLEGRVLAQGKPVAGATVAAAGRTARTDFDGRFSFEPLPVAGSYALAEVRVRAPGYGEWTLAGARLVPYDTLRVTAELQRGEVRLTQPPLGGGRAALSPAAPRTPAASASNDIPPPTIRVFVTGNRACDTSPSGEVRVVDFREYVKHVLPNEWMPGWRQESLRAGAMAAKSFAWYYINRGGKWPGLGADLMDNTCDQVYTPYASYASTDAAVDATWNYKITRDGGIHICQYWAGAPGDGSKPSSGSAYAGRMSQWGSEYWAGQGKTWQWILDYYYDNTVVSSIITPSGTVSLNRGSQYTRSPSVKVRAPAVAGSGVTQLRVSNTGATSNGVLSAGKTYAYQVPIDWSLADATYGGSDRNGTRTVYVQWRAGTAKWSRVRGDSIVLDTERPGVSAPFARFAVSSALGTWRVPVRLAWSGSDATSGIGVYHLQRSVNGGAHTDVTRATSTAYRDVGLGPGYTHAFYVRAQDRALNWSRWAYGVPFELRAYQETDAGIIYSGNWPRQSSDQAYGGATKYSIQAGASARFVFTGRAVAWVAARGPSRGVARVYIDGAYIASVDLYSPEARPRTIVYARSWSSGGAHTLEVRAVGTAGRPRVDVDAFATLR